MMQKWWFLILIGLCAFRPSSAEEWFEEQTPLTRAHQALLEDDLPEAFSAMVQVWQNAGTPYIKEHLNQLLQKSLDRDCGKSLYNEELAVWIKKVLIRKQSVQSPGRKSERLTIEAITTEEVRSIELTRWPEHDISRSSEFKQIESQQDDLIYQQQYSLNRSLAPGLYQLSLETEKGEIWNTWLIIGNSALKQVVRWESKDSWVVDKKELLNAYCPLPVLDVSLYDYVDGQYVKVWQQGYEVDYPSVIPVQQLEPDRYVLAVSIAHQRWQGPIIIEDQQVISKTYDISEE
jgi:hypothetical protein